MYEYQQVRGKIGGDHPGGFGLVCCIALQENLRNLGWRSKLISVFEDRVSDIDAIWYPPKIWTGPQSYQSEMGGALSNIVFVLAGRVALEDVIRVKRRSVEMEKSCRAEFGREVNINPGFLAADGLVLASHKSSPIRRQVANDVFLERQQVFVPEKGLVPLSTAFSEYQTPERRDLLEILARGCGKIPLLQSTWEMNEGYPGWVMSRDPGRVESSSTAANEWSPVYRCTTGQVDLLRSRDCVEAIAVSDT